MSKKTPSFAGPSRGQKKKELKVCNFKQDFFHWIKVEIAVWLLI